MRLPLEIRELASRQGNNESSSNNTKSNMTFIIVCVTIIVFVIAIIITFAVLRRYRQSHYEPSYVPTRFLKQKWREWTPKTKYGRMSSGVPSPRSSRLEERTAYEPTPTETITAPAGGVDRNTSVRSVMTLPAYAPAPRPTERVIGREGERAGMDVVVEFPETVDEEEARREEEMESLYQIRQARRQEIADREERRRLRREARESGDMITLEELRAQSRLRAESAASLRNAAAASTTSLGAESMIAEHNARDRERRVSSVSYAELGLARHDGTRLRADSVESDHRPLLDSAASFGGSTRGSFFMVPQRRRDHSTSSILSVSTNASDDDGHTPQTSTTQGGSGSDPLQTPSASQDTPPADIDLGGASTLQSEPPEYDYVGNHGESREEEAPPYESPVRTGAPQLPPLKTLPAIEVTSSTPANSVHATPITGRNEPDSWGRGDR
ncbi:MAG: hypothetical protein M1830_007518 [Pleopsidium flavum]|nr:MAG: hypothetical protein M1830_007518 [Pleopsidium flavum]